MDNWTIFLGLAGLGIAIFSIFSPHMGINIPRALAWSGGSFGILLVICSIIILAWKPQRLSIGPTILIIACLSGLVGGIIWQIDSLQKIQAEDSIEKKQPTAEEIASEIVKKLPKDTQRPWILVEGITDIEPFIINDHGSSIKLSIVIKNYGKIPATNIIIIPGMAAVAIKDGMRLYAAVLEALILSNNYENLRSKIGGTILGPDKMFAQPLGFVIRRANIISAEQAGNDRNRVIFAIGGCIDYSFPGGTGQTTFNYFLSEKFTGKAGIDITPRIIPIDKLELRQETFGVYAK